MGDGLAAWALVMMIAAAPPAEQRPVEIYPGQDIQAAVNAAGPGTSFTLKPGVHRLQMVRPKEGDTFASEPGAILSGARPLLSFARAGSVWVATGQAQQNPRAGVCEPEYSRCTFPEQLFIDDQPLRHVDSLREVVDGTWFFDYTAHQIYIGTDPADRRVETSVTAVAFDATANRVTITGLVIEKYANPAQRGAVNGEGKTDWVVAGNEIRLNHGVGVRVGAASRVEGNNVHHNGQLGVSAQGAAVIVGNNEIAFNNTAHFDAGWEAGGGKFVSTSGLVLRGNFVHHNAGPGLWADIDNIGTLYEDNTCEDNQRSGIFHEISYAAVIRNNIVRRNGFGMSDWMGRRNSRRRLARRRSVRQHGPGQCRRHRRGAAGARQRRVRTT
jgi:parallel beta-helix repeat protein